MHSIGKNPRVRLNHSEYAALRLSVMKRDGWRCQQCGTREHLEVHHVGFRSRSGSDVPDNLLTLCSSCHRGVHEHKTLHLVGPHGSP